MKPYVSNKAYLDRDYGIRKDADGQFLIGNSLNYIDEDSNVNVRGKRYIRTQRLFELCALRKVKHSLIIPYDLTNYKNILEVKSGVLENNDPSGVLKIKRGVKFR